MIRDALFSPPDMPLWLPRLVFSVTLVCLAAAMANFLLRRFSAAMRHRVWALGIAASLAMPAMIFWSPELRLGWLNVAPPRPVVAVDPVPDVDVPPVPVPHQLAGAEHPAGRRYGEPAHHLARLVIGFGQRQGGQGPGRIQPLQQHGPGPGLEPFCAME